jgi:hypothetical protein
MSLFLYLSSGHHRRVLSGILLAFVFFAPIARAQVETQTLILQPGWNSVYLMVTPVENRPAQVFADQNIKSVWYWNKSAAVSEFIDDPQNLTTSSPDWLFYFPAQNAERAELTNLHAVFGGRAYLVELQGTQAVTLNVSGVPVNKEIDWIVDSYNLVGFSTSSGSPPTFSQFLPSISPSPIEKVFKLSAAGEWVQVTLATDKVNRGTAYWFYVNDRLSFQGPTSVSGEINTSLAFGASLDQLFLTITNTGSQSANIQITPRASAAGQESPDGPVVGSVPLDYYEFNAATNTSRWVDLSSWQPVSLAPNGSLQVRLAPRRSEFAPFTTSAPEDVGLYASLVEISDNRGMNYVLPVSALQRGIPAGKTTNDTASRYGGLWVGSVVLDKVNEPSNNAAPLEPVATGSGLTFPIIIHVDNLGQINLLQEVIQMWTPAVTNPATGEVTQPASYVNLPSVELAQQYQPVGLVDTKAVSRRISSAAFVFPFDTGSNKRIDRIAFSGDFASTLSCSIVLSSNDPLNPFVHRYHPDHNNLDGRFETPVSESFEISRTISLTIDGQRAVTDEPNDGLNSLEGAYLEVLSGVHKTPLHLSGRFTLRRISSEMDPLP